VRVDIVLCPTDELTDDERADREALSRAVYPPDVSAVWPGRHLEWSCHDAAVLIRAGNGELICYAGLIVRSALCDERHVRVGGIGGVKTHPAVRGQGWGKRAVRRAMEFFHERADIDFALLVCEPHLIGYYWRLGWRVFGGRLLVRQRGVPVEFTFNRVMVCGVQASGPSAGTIDLLGPPW
jgi:predicted GNAT family N-acyltransferase